MVNPNIVSGSPIRSVDLQATGMDDADYLIYVTGSTFYAKGGSSGIIEYSGSVLATVFSNANARLTSAGGGIIWLRDINVPASTIGPNVIVVQANAGTLTLISGSTTFGQSVYITGSQSTLGPTTLSGSLNVTGSTTLSGGNTIGSTTFTGSLTFTSGSSSIFPFALPATYVMFSGSVPNLTGPFYVTSGSSNLVIYSGTDAATVFASAWNNLSGSSGNVGGKIFIRSGTYPIVGTPSLNLVNNVFLEGEGPSTVLFLAAGASRPIISFPSGSPITGLVIRNLLFDGNGLNQTNVANTSLIVLGSPSSSNIRILENVFQNSRNSVITTAAVDLIVSSNKFINNVTGSVASGANGYLGTILSTGYQNQNINLKIIGNSFDGNVVGINDNDSGSFGVVISGNSFVNTYNSAITNNAVARMVISNNYFSNSSTATTNFIALGSQETLIENNWFFNTGTAMQAHITDTAPLFNSIIGNQFEGGNISTAVINVDSVGGGQNEIISGNTFRLGVSAKGIRARALAKFVISGNQFNLPFGGTSISFETTASTNGVICDNFMDATPFAFTVTPTTLFIHDNVNYNPVGYITPDATVGASPYIYTNLDFVAEDVYLISGSVTTVTGSGNFSYPTTSPIRLAPGQAISVTYSSAPTVKRLGF